MYGGDEVSAIVIDLGSHTCKAGYAGEDAPKAVFPSVVGAIDQMDIDEPDNTEKNSADSKNNVRNPDSDKAKGKRKLYVGSQSLGYRRDHMEVLSPLKDGIVADWDIVDSIWDHAFRECLLIDPKEHPMLLAEPSSNTQQQRERTAELMFEKYKVPALFLAKNAVLTSFASGRATALVVDGGGGSTTVAPVHDGYVLQKAVATSPVGGEFLTDCLMKSLESKGIVIKPRYSFKRKEIRPGEFQTVDLDFPNTTESYKLYSQRVIASDIKECVCRAPDTPYDESAYSNIPMTPYELPDGQTIEIGADRFKIPDVLFNPSLVQTIPGMENFAEIAPSVRGLPQMVIESINKCDVDIRRELFSSILLAGGTASMQQLKERLEKDLLEESPQAARVKVLASGNATERRSGKSSRHDIPLLPPIKEPIFSPLFTIGGNQLSFPSIIKGEICEWPLTRVAGSCSVWIGMMSMELPISKENAHELLSMIIQVCYSADVHPDDCWKSSLEP
ncbi:Actin-related protein 4 [Senna tora]|uniref:Actin-related protein 4 n=2 Tax=Caesalpinioideae TaxID=3804 RepID=A0A834TPJ8_9FABA|nr:Actin-related protein 4 [Senna tora]